MAIISLGIGLISVVALFIGLVLLPFTLYKGFANKNWKQGKMNAILIGGGFIGYLVAQFIYFSYRSQVPFNPQVPQF